MHRFTLEGKIKYENRKKQMQELRNKGFSYEEIGKIMGISHQRVHQIIGKGNKALFRPIKPTGCVFDGIRQWMNENQISISELVRIIYGNTCPENYNRIRSYLTARNDIRKTLIDKILSITNLTYEEAFKRSDNK